MSRPLRLIWLLLGVGSLALLVGLLLVTPTWRVVRERDVAAPPERIFPFLDDLQAWRRWSPWQESDYAGLTFEYSGPARGPGAELRWDSEATGDGLLRITESRPPRAVTFEMAFQEGKISARDTIELLPLPGGATRVVWTDEGRLGRTLLGRLSLPVIERSMARDLDRGLERLAGVVETPVALEQQAEAAEAAAPAALLPGTRPAALPALPPPAGDPAADATAPLDDPAGDPGGAEAPPPPPP